MVQARCFKEKKQVTIKDPQFDINKVGRPVARGVCGSCGSTVFTIIKYEDAPDNIKAKVDAFKKKKGGSHSKKSARSAKSRKSKSRRSRK